MPVKRLMQDLLKLLLESGDHDTSVFPLVEVGLEVFFYMHLLYRILIVVIPMKPGVEVSVNPQVFYLSSFTLAPGFDSVKGKYVFFRHDNLFMLVCFDLLKTIELILLLKISLNDYSFRSA